MKTNKIVAGGIISSLAVATLTGVFSASIDTATVDNLFVLAGLGFFVFGIWASVILLKK